MLRLTFLLLISLIGYSINADDSPDLSQLQSPFIEGETLFISGPIDSHIYDYFSRERNRIIASVKKISLNSYGGSHNWSLEVARQIRDLNLFTLVDEGSVCASACVYLFGAGKERWMHNSVWLGLHGARLSGHYISTFHGSCFVSISGEMTFIEDLDGCKESIDNWYEIAMTATQRAFDSLELSGVSPDLREDYFALPDDENWFRFNNVIRKPDWVLQPEEALSYGLATQIIE